MADSQEVRKAINSLLKIRVILVTSWIYTIVGLSCAMVVWFSGRLDASPKMTTMMTFNTSDLGLSAYYDSSSPLHEPIRALVPPEIDNPVTIARFLGIKDWYSTSYLWICAGMYGYNDTTKVFTGAIIDPDCGKRKWGGAVFSLRENVEQGLHPSVKALAGEIPQKTYHTTKWVWASCIGWWIALLSFAIMPWAFIRGKSLGKGSWSLIPTSFVFIAFALFLSVTIEAGRELPSDKDTPESKLTGKRSPTFLTLNILSVVFMFISFCVGVLGWGVGVWLEDSLPSLERTDADADSHALGNTVVPRPANAGCHNNFPRRTAEMRCVNGRV